MKNLFAATALAFSLIGGGVTTAQADGREHRYERRNDHRGHDCRDERRGFHDHRSRHWDRHDGYRVDYSFRHHAQRRYDYGRYVRPRGYYYRAWRHGEHLPAAYYSRRYIVHDYHAYRLGPPPRGYHWVRVNNDVVLAAIASGLVVQAVYGIFY